MSDAPERIHILTSDAEMLLELRDGQADTSIVGASPLRNIHGELSTTEYIRADLYEELVEGIKSISWCQECGGLDGLLENVGKGKPTISFWESNE